MTARSFFRGHEIETLNSIWIYSDTKQKVILNPNRCCENCGEESTKDDHDACIKDLPYAMNACCGHGDIKETYIQYWNGHVIEGEKARIIIDALKKE